MLALASMPFGLWALTALPVEWVRVLIALVSIGAFVLIVTPISAAVFLWRGVGGLQKIKLAAALFPAVLIGDWFGHRAFGRASKTQWQVATALVLGGAAIGAMWKLAA